MDDMYKPTSYIHSFIKVAKQNPLKITFGSQVYICEVSERIVLIFFLCKYISRVEECALPAWCFPFSEPNQWIRVQREFSVHPCLDYTLMDYSRLNYSWLDYRHLDYLWCLDYRRLDYFRLQGHSDYRDIWTIAIWTITVWTILDYRDVWTTRTFGLLTQTD